jgi:hypothetical protein
MRSCSPPASPLRFWLSRTCRAHRRCGRRWPSTRAGSWIRRLLEAVPPGSVPVWPQPAAQHSNAAPGKPKPGAVPQRPRRSAPVASPRVLNSSGRTGLRARSPAAPCGPYAQIAKEPGVHRLHDRARRRRFEILCGPLPGLVLLIVRLGLFAHVAPPCRTRGFYASCSMLNPRIADPVRAGGCPRTPCTVGLKAPYG